MAEQTEPAPGAQEFIPPQADTIDELRAAAAGCQGCQLYRNASQTVFGRGDESARVVFVGEQPGDLEDQKGLPFVGPAGRLLRKAVDDAGIDPGHIYLTNAVALFRGCRYATVSAHDLSCQRSFTTTRCHPSIPPPGRR
ncbi:uracil-DNA glycosylase family protein [Micromonospora coerulea]|uniref:uracil-DNA glycosylase family protein n=1 Tax=Micromonospora coerulea TaxID=47856 RepID=UPI001F3DB8D2|nr:uracil-DNA glycosylase family protein [Micromonospora veneta]